ncbi:MAG: cyclic nucleotide-binding domain-containing protein [Deltaproteobacteria bacterium]|nr:cyclic nucleotide-binding domain-containing protein [Deltaproteobacteria bacterium]
MSLYDLVNDMEIFQTFSEEEKKIFSEMKHSVMKFDKGDVIIKEGDDSVSLYLLLDGTCLITKTESDATIRLSKLKAGEFFGEMSFFSKNPRQSDVVANDRVTVINMDYNFFQQIDPNVRDKIKDYLLQLLISRLDNMNSAIMRISKLMRI